MKLGDIFRACVRAPTALAWTLTCHGYLRLRGKLRPGKWGDRRATDVIGKWGAGLTWIMGGRVVKRNERQGPMGDVIIANHMGFMDVPVLLSLYPSVFVIKDEMRKVFFFGKALVNQGHVFVKRDKTSSRKSARDGVRKVLEVGDRIIIFPEGFASHKVERSPFKPFSFFEAKRQNKTVEFCLIDYLPDREEFKWDTSRKMLPQLLEIIGRKRTEISVEFFKAELPDDPEKTAQFYHDLCEQKLKEYDRQKQSTPE